LSATIIGFALIVAAASLLAATISLLIVATSIRAIAALVARLRVAILEAVAGSVVERVVKFIAGTIIELIVHSISGTVSELVTPLVSSQRADIVATTIQPPARCVWPAAVVVQCSLDGRIAKRIAVEVLSRGAALSARAATVLNSRSAPADVVVSEIHPLVRCVDSSAIVHPGARTVNIGPIVQTSSPLVRTVGRAIVQRALASSIGVETVLRLIEP
jgi:hypothetical protein